MLNYMIVLVLYLACMWLFAEVHDYVVKKGKLKSTKATRITFSLLWPLVILMVFYFFIQDMLKFEPRS